MRPSKNTRNNTKRKLFIIISLLVVLCAGILGYYLINGSSEKSDDNINYDPPTSEQKRAGQDAKKEAIDRGTATPSAPESNESLVDFSVMNDGERGILNVSTQLANTVSWDKCFLKLQQGQNIKNYEARTVYQPASSFCGGFSIPSDGLSGTWQISLRATDLNGKSYEKTKSFEVQ